MSTDNIKVGDYVRTEYGIAKIKSFETKNKEVINLDKDIILCNMDCYRNCCTINQVIKSKPNIMDLIEKHDYIRLEDRGNTYYEVVEVPWSRGRNILAIEDRSWDELEEIYEKEEITSIITHEQMRQMEYKIER